MKEIQCAGAIFIDDENNVLLEDRRKISKHGEEWSFFGGTIEEGESVENALKREIKEELEYNLQDYEFFTEYSFQVDDLDITYHMFLTKMPNLKELQLHTGARLRKFPISEALDLKITNADKAILSKLQKHLGLKQKHELVDSCNNMS